MREGGSLIHHFKSQPLEYATLAGADASVIWHSGGVRIMSNERPNYRLIWSRHSRRFTKNLANGPAFTPYFSRDGVDLSIKSMQVATVR